MDVSIGVIALWREGRVIVSVLMFVCPITRQGLQPISSRGKGGADAAEGPAEIPELQHLILVILILLIQLLI